MIHHHSQKCPDYVTHKKKQNKKKNIPQWLFGLSYSPQPLKKKKKNQMILYIQSNRKRLLDSYLTSMTDMVWLKHSYC